MESLTSDDIFTFVFLSTFFENQNEIYESDLESDNAISIAVYLWVKGKSDLEELQKVTKYNNKCFWVIIGKRVL